MPFVHSFLHNKRRAVLLAFALLILCLPSPLSASRKNGRVLLLNSYSVEDFWTAETNRGIFAAFADQGMNADFFVEDLDITGTFSALHLPELRSLYRSRYTSTPPDLIITTENDAATFALGQSGTLFPPVPIVFCSLTNRSLLSIFPPEKGTGVFSEQTTLFLLREILRLHPEAPRIALITDMTPRGFRDIARMNEAAAALSLKGERITPLFGLNIDQIGASLDALPAKSVVIVGHYSVTKEGELISFPHLLEAIQGVSDLPIYSLIEEGAALGVLGSVSGRGFQKGYAAGEIAVSIMKGKKTETIPPKESAETRLLFNYAGMREFNIPRASLPERSIILGDPFQGLHQHAPLLFGNTALILSLGGLAFYLKRKISGRIKTEDELLQQTEYWKKLFENSPQGILIYDGSGRIKEANSRFREMFRIPAHVVPENILSLLSGAETNFTGEDIFPASAHTSGVVAPTKEAILPDGDGGALSVSFLAFRLSSIGEEENYCALFDDIRERKSLEAMLRRRSVLQERMTAISSRFVLFQNFGNAMETALNDVISLSGARSASLFVMSETGVLVPEMEVFAPDKSGTPSLAEDFSDADDFVWKSLLLKERTPAVLVIDSAPHKLRDDNREFLRNKRVGSITVLPLFVKEIFQGFLALVEPDPQWTDASDEPLLMLFSDLMAMAIERRKEEEGLRATHDRIHDRFTGAITALCQVSELRDVSTSGHQKNVSALAASLAEEMQLSEEIRMAVRYAGLVHDLGKLYIPAEILGKPTRLSEAEYELVKKHPEFGHDILSLLNFPWPLAEIVLQHHERIDGSGYPFGLSKKDIRLEARILSVVDAYEAMTSDRPYRKQKSKNTALKELMDHAGTAYDVKIVRAFVKMMRERSMDI